MSESWGQTSIRSCSLPLLSSVSLGPSPQPWRSHYRWGGLTMRSESEQLRGWSVMDTVRRDSPLQGRPPIPQPLRIPAAVSSELRPSLDSALPRRHPLPGTVVVGDRLMGVAPRPSSRSLGQLCRAPRLAEVSMTATLGDIFSLCPALPPLPPFGYISQECS